MKNPFENIDRAFDCMCDEDVVVECKDKSSLTIHAFIMTDNTEEAPDEFLDSECEIINIVPSNRRCEFARKIERGDKITRWTIRGTKQYSVQDVIEDFAMGYIIKAKSI